MKIKKLINDYLKFSNQDEIEIYFRTNYPKSIQSELSAHELKYGMLFGIATWNGKGLTSLDGDIYSLDIDYEDCWLEHDDDNDKYYITVFELVEWYMDD